MTFKILAVSFSQTGQLERTLGTFLEPFGGQNFQITQIKVEPEHPFPFPWGFLPFFEAMPETVLGIPRRVKSIAIDPNASFDLVVLGYQPWFLSLSQPVQAFLNQYGALIFKNRPVIAITACRDMWHEAFLQLRSAVEGFGGRIVEHVVVTDPTPKLLSLFTTPIWLAFGKKKFLAFPEAGLRTPEYAFVRSQGARYGNFLKNQKTLPASGFLMDPSRLDINKVFTEILGRALFRVSARFAVACGHPGTWQRRVAIGWFLCYFLVSLPVILILGHIAYVIVAKLLPQKLVRYEGVFCCGT